MKIKVLTSFGPGGWEDYGENLVKSFAQHWPREVDLEVCYHDQEHGGWPEYPNVKYRDINATDPEHDKFVAGCSELQKGGDYRMDVVKFCHKVFALTSTDLKDYDWLIWLDGDTETYRDLPMGDLTEWLQNSDLVYLDRSNERLPYPETSFVAFNLNSHRAHSLLNDLRGTYITGEVFHYREWHDGFIFGRLLKLHQQHGMETFSLTQDLHSKDSFDSSPLSQYMMHLKGPLKQMKPLITQMRYDLLVEMVDKYKPSVIMETGTWKGERAIQLAQAAFKNKDQVHYLGFDLFEDATVDTDTVEMNTKAHTTRDLVNARLKAFSDVARRHGKTFTWELHKGDTKKTLAQADLSKVDFAYLDGGHSYDTVKADFGAVAHVPVVILDDFFSKDEHGLEPPVEHKGTNRVLEGRKFKLLPRRDPVRGGGYTQLALVLNDSTLEYPEFTQPLKINPKDCVPQDNLLDNVKKNATLLKEWLKPCAQHNGTALVVSGGPSLSRYLPRIKRMVEKGAKVFCVKHAYPVLINAGIPVWACVILDPRPFLGVSTHGAVRKELLEKVDPATRFFVATMTDPGVTEHLITKGAHLVGWHAYSNAAKATKLDQDQHWITGGTCAAFRAISIAHFIGFRKLHLFAFDLAVTGKRGSKELDEFGRPKYLYVEIGQKKRKRFWSTGEMLSAAQDFEKLVGQLHDTGITLKVHGPGICQQIWKDMEWKPLPKLEDLYP
jgi:hypothetical protein